MDERWGDVCCGTDEDPTMWSETTREEPTPVEDSEFSKNAAERAIFDILLAAVRMAKSDKVSRGLTKVPRQKKPETPIEHRDQECKVDPIQDRDDDGWTTVVSRKKKKAARSEAPRTESHKETKSMVGSKRSARRTKRV